MFLVGSWVGCDMPYFPMTALWGLVWLAVVIDLCDRARRKFVLSPQSGSYITVTEW